MTRSGRYRLEILPLALRTLQDIGDPWQERIRRAIRELADDPTPTDSEAMTGKGEGLRRIRVGTYRVVYRVVRRQLLVLVVRIGHRRHVYSGLEGR